MGIGAVETYFDSSSLPARVRVHVTLTLPGTDEPVEVHPTEPLHFNISESRDGTAEHPLDFGDQFRALAAIQREFNATVRLSNRQNLVFRDLDETQLPALYDRLAAIGMAQPGAELVRTRGLGHVRLLRDAAVIARVVDFVTREPRAAYAAPPLAA